MVLVQAEKVLTFAPLWKTPKVNWIQTGSVQASWRETGPPTAQECGILPLLLLLLQLPHVRPRTRLQMRHAIGFSGTDREA